MSDNQSKVSVCQSKVCEVQVLIECPNEKLIPIGKEGPLVAKIPVVIAEPKVQVNIESVITLEEPALEIKRSKKNVYLTQCKLIDMGNTKSGKLFISGFIRKNIEYATVDCEHPENKTITGNIRHTTIRIPFKCVTEVDYVFQPVIRSKGVKSEVEIFNDNSEICNPYSQKNIGSNTCEHGSQNLEQFTEKIFCELVEVQIFEEDTNIDPDSLGCAFPNEQVFQKVQEKTVLFITLKVLQNQQVDIPKSHACNNENIDKMEYGDAIINNGWRSVRRNRAFSRRKNPKSG